MVKLKEQYLYVQRENATARSRSVRRRHFSRGREHDASAPVRLFGKDGDRGYVKSSRRTGLTPRTSELNYASFIASRCQKRIGFKDAVKGGFENNGPVVHFVFYFRDHEFKCTGFSNFTKGFDSTRRTCRS